jgi:uncharacterized protein with HEPN domain
MSERTDREFLLDMLEAARRIQAYIGEMDFKAFQRDFKTQDAVVRNLEVLGEAAKNIPDEFRVRHPDLPWRAMAGTRDRLIHHYFGVNLDIVWDIVSLELPGVIGGIESILGGSRDP